MNTINEHPLTEVEAGRIWDENRSAPTIGWANLTRGTKNGVLAIAHAAYNLAVERTHADDGWEPLGREDELRVGDEWRRVAQGITSTGVVASLGADGNPWTAGGYVIGVRDNGTWHVRRAPVTWHRLPTERPAHLTDVTGPNGETCAHMALARAVDWCGIDSDGWLRTWRAAQIAACTLDGTRLVRDGEFEDGTPRFREEAGE